MFLAALILFLAAAALMPLERYFHRHLEGITSALADHVYLPVLRTLALIAFLLCLNPQQMFQLAQPIANIPLLAAPWGRWLNALFFLGLILPALPHLHRFNAWILPLQTLLGAYLLARGLAQANDLNLQTSFWNAAGLAFVLFLALSQPLILYFSRLPVGPRCWQRYDALSRQDALALAVQPWAALILSRSWSLS